MFAKRLVSIAVSCAALTGGTLAMTLAAPSAGAAPTELIVGHSSGCTGTYATISDANAAALAGDTIKVCAGRYDETVNVTTPDLTFLGAQVGKPGTDLLGSKSPQSVVGAVNGGFLLSSTANDTKIDGFSITGAGSATVNADGIEAFAGSSGLDAADNFIYKNGNGINVQNPTASMPATISGNFIADNTREGNVDSNPQTGTGVFISNGPADNTSISDNTFSGDSQTAINFAGEAGTPSTGLVVDGNHSINDSTFVVAVNSTDALIQDNIITVKTNHVVGGNGTGILDFGDNTGLRIYHNSLTSVSSVNAAIQLSTYAGSPSTGTTVSDNTVSGWGYGVYVSTDYVSTDVTDNTVSGNGTTGIYLESGTSGNVITHNTLSKDAGAADDCTDASVGSGTAGTANSWLHNVGKDHNSSPAAICPA
jgi:parallel beta-helix repeat protein